MFAGVGIIGALASILASILVPAPKTEDEPARFSGARTVHDELVEIKAELSALRTIALGRRRTSRELTPSAMRRILTAGPSRAGTAPPA